MHPKVKFELNKTLDIRMALHFLYTKHAGIDFSCGVTNIHKDLKSRLEKADNDTEEIVSSYFNSFYTKNNLLLKRKKEEFEEEWRRVEDNFFNITTKLFKGHNYPQGKYIGYVSIVNCNPRFLHNKTFQIFYHHPQGVRYAIAHELLHFIFYDYAIKKHSQLFLDTNTEEGPLWDMAEIFNSILLHTPDFVEVHGIKEKINYPKHSRLISRLVNVWREDQDINAFIETAYNIIAQNYTHN